MIGLDTNVVVRLLTGDDAAQARRAADFIATQADRGDPVFISLVVLTETAWVLKSVYGYPRTDVQIAFENLLGAGAIMVEQQDAVRAALQREKRRNTDFADMFIGVASRAHGCPSTVTFDRRAAKQEGFSVL